MKHGSSDMENAWLVLKPVFDYLDMDKCEFEDLFERLTGAPLTPEEVNQVGMEIAYIIQSVLDNR